MSKLIEPHVSLIIFSLCFILCRCGSHRGLSSCDVEVQVRRGTVYRVSPHEHVVVKCPVQHCGQTVHVVWCKLLDSEGCKELNNSESIQIKSMQSDKKLESILTFNQISVEDAGLYTCREKKSGLVGHLINVTVSEAHRGVQNSDGNTDEPSNNVPNQESEIMSLAYFVIFLSFVLVLFTITIIVLLRMYGCKRTIWYTPKTQEEPSTHMIPGLRSPPARRQNVSIVNDIYNTVAVSHSEMTTRNQYVAHTSRAQASDYATYAQINRTQSRKSFQNYSTDPGSNKNNVTDVLT